jgi:hypothetical protein
MNKKLSKRNILIAGLLSLTMGFTACEKAEYNYNETPVTKPNVTFVALTSAVTSGTSATQPSALIRYNANNTGAIVTTAYTIPNLTGSESIIGIDYRPSTGVLYGLSSTGRLFTLTFTTNASTGAITGLTSAVVGTVTPAISGNVAGFDFNPVADRIRIVTTTGQNLRVDPTNATATVDGAINGVTGALITGTAYTNSVKTPAPTTTELYSLDVAAQMLYKQDANAGTLTAVGPLGNTPLPLTNTGYAAAYNTAITNARTGATGGFDISGSGVALAVFSPNNAPAISAGQISAADPSKGLPANPSSTVSAISNPSTLFMINLQTGKATDLGVLPIIAASNYAAASNIIGIAIAP